MIKTTLVTVVGLSLSACGGFQSNSPRSQIQTDSTIGSIDAEETVVINPVVSEENRTDPEVPEAPEESTLPPAVAVPPQVMEPMVPEETNALDVDEIVQNLSGLSGCHSEMTCDVLELVNVERGIAGESPLTPSPNCLVSAAIHAEDMALNNYFSHTSLNGATPPQRIGSQGGLYAGENIAAGQGSAEGVMLSWMNSPGHKIAILNPSARSLGVAVARNSFGRLYWVQNFCR